MAYLKTHGHLFNTWGYNSILLYLCCCLNCLCFSYCVPLTHRITVWGGVCVCTCFNFSVLPYFMARKDTLGFSSVSYPKPRIHHFSKEPLFLLFQDGIRDLGTLYAHCCWVSLFLGLSADTARKYTHTFTFLIPVFLCVLAAC